MNAYRDWLKEHKSSIHDRYFRFLKIPSVSGQPDKKKDCLACAEFVIDWLKEMGLTVSVWETSYNPVIFAERIVDPSLPTYLLYNHYDVQPAEPLELWKSPPFEPTERNGRIYARGASDNKGQCSYTLSALQAFLEKGQKDKINLKILIEGDEETGSKGLSEVVETKAKELKADHVLIVDVEVPSMEKPGVTLGMRGIMTMHVDCIGADRDVHSGSFGGIMANPARVLMQAVAQLWDETGKVAVPGFYDNVEAMPPKEQEMLDKNVDYADLMKQVGGRAYGNEKGKELYEANWLRPTLEVNGFGSGYVGEEVKTIIPGQARVMLSMRLVPGQDPERLAKLVGDFLKKNIANGMELKIEWGHGGVGLRTSPKAKLALVAKKAIEEVTGKKASYLLAGATIPVAMGLQKATGGEVIGIGYGLTCDEIHAPNESFGLDQFETGFLTICKLLDEAGNV